MASGTAGRGARFALVVIAGALAFVGTAAAQPSSTDERKAPPAAAAGEQAAPPAQAAPAPVGEPSPGQLRLPNGEPAVVLPVDPRFDPRLDPTAPLPGSVMRRPEQLRYRPSGFWTSNRPARGGAYRWRILAVGTGVLGVTMFFVLRLLRRSSRQRDAALAAR